MARHVALLRAVNVGGTGKLPMTELKRMGEEAGFTAVRTYIASGNLLFRSEAGEEAVRAALEQRLAAYAGKPVAVYIRTAEALAALVARNPFSHGAPNRVVAILLDGAPPADALTRVIGRQDEEIVAGERELFVHYGDGMARSRLRIPAADHGTARNMNTLAKLAELAAAL
ncbi:MAG TPA: DUF1697 domain-containing protein [Sphingobium sp.]|nr:DUF1697 domain-containing protein [Sphingobium sp.]